MENTNKMSKEEKQYIPFGLEWYKEMRKLNKDTIISLVEKNCKEKDKLREQNKALTDEIEELKRINSNLEARVKSWDKMYKTLLQENLDLQSRISELEKVNDSLKEAFKRGSELNDKLKFD